MNNALIFIGCIFSVAIAFMVGGVMLIDSVNEEIEKND